MPGALGQGAELCLRRPSPARWTYIVSAAAHSGTDSDSLSKASFLPLGSSVIFDLVPAVVFHRGLDLVVGLAQCSGGGHLGAAGLDLVQGAGEPLRAGGPCRRRRPTTAWAR